MKKLLVLGGKPIGSVELVQRAKGKGYYVIVADYLPVEQSPAKYYADEEWNISTANIDILEKMCKANHVDGILTAVHEFNINRMLDLCERLGKPCYCRRSTWRYCDDKVAFKHLCMSNNIPVARKYDIDINKKASLVCIPYPVICKPVDGSSSRGFSICQNEKELISGYKHALDFSAGKQVLCEDYIPYDAVIIHYTMINGKCYYSGMSDKISCNFPTTGASVMGFQTFPSKGENIYLQSLNDSVCHMLEQAGFTDGPVWIEAFYDGEHSFIFNEMGYRLGGSLTNNPVKFFYGIDQLDLMLAVSMDDKCEFELCRNHTEEKYCIIPIHIRSGKITDIKGIDSVKKRNDISAIVPVHYLGDEIEDWGSAQQVFCYLHLLYKDNVSLKKSIEEVLYVMRVLDQDGENMLHTLFDLNRLI